MAAIYTLDSETITEGLQGCSQSDEALHAARRITADRGETVVLDDADGIWLVAPDGSYSPFEGAR